MTRPLWWSQPFAPEGSAAAEGIAKQLGRPALDELTILVREAAQNSWDARRTDETASFGISLRRIGDRADAWKQALLPAPSSDSIPDLPTTMNPDSIVMLVSDRGTRGLCGPIRAGVRAGPTEGNDFVQFLRNVGEARDHEFGGGTYGFGKGIFYRLSSASTVLVDSRIDTIGDDNRRLMGASLGQSFFDEHDRRHTGRHWWGTIAEDNVPDPIMGETARRLAAELGLPGFEDGRTGTDIVILGPDLGMVDDDVEGRGRTPEEAAVFMASSILWNLWPKLVHADPSRRMTFSVDVDGVPIDIPDPAETDDFIPFVESLRKIHNGGGTSYARRTAPKLAGAIAVAQAAADVGIVASVVSAAKPFQGSSHHIARMRQAELVVDYLECFEHPNPLLRYAGVYQASEEADEYFALAEPPTHDDWVEKGLNGVTKAVVLGARTFIKRRVDQNFGNAPDATGQGAPGLGALAARLAAMVPRTPQSMPNGLIAERSPQGGRGVSRNKAPRIIEGPVLTIQNGTPLVVARVRIPARDSNIIARAEVSVVLDGGTSESSIPLGASAPRVLQWLNAGGGEPIRSSAISVKPGAESEWWVYASYVSDAVIRMKIISEKPIGD